MQASITARLLLDHDILENPNDFYHQLIEQAPVWKVGDTNVYTANSYAAVTEACRRVEDFSNDLRFILYRDESGLPARYAWDRSTPALASADPPDHGRHKKVVSPPFSPKRIASLEAGLVERTHHYLSTQGDTGRVEFMSALANRIPIEVVSSLIGFSESNTDALLRLATVQTDMLASAIPREVLEQRLSVSDDTLQWIVDQLQAALREPGDGILGALARAINEGEMETTVAVTILATLFAAGGESTSSLIGNAVHMLATDAALQELLRQEPSLIPRFVEEALRLEAPFRHLMRWVPHDTKLCDVDIPGGSSLLLMWGAANRDPAAFNRPDEIDLDRPRSHVAFGSGIHVCLGNTLARLEARVILETLLAATREIAIDDQEKATQVPSLAVRRFRTLPLVMDRR